MDERIIKARKLAEQYKLQKYHCSESIIRAVPEALGFEVSDDVIKAACAFFAGGGGTKGRCGVFESCMMLMSLLYGRMTPAESDNDLRILSEELVKRFTEKFGSLNCADIKPAEIERYGEDFSCMRIYRDGAELVAQLLIDAPELLNK